jgi:2-keto-3-deoxy-6-phosphogluconate aldolase
VPFADNVIENLKIKYLNGEIILAAGTVLDPGAAKIAILSGSEHFVSS